MTRILQYLEALERCAALHPLTEDQARRVAHITELVLERLEAESEVLTAPPPPPEPARAPEVLTPPLAVPPRAPTAPPPPPAFAPAPTLRAPRPPRPRARLPWDPAQPGDALEPEGAAPRLPDELVEPGPRPAPARRGPEIRAFEPAEGPTVSLKVGLGEGLTAIAHRVIGPLLGRQLRWEETRLGVQCLIDSNPGIDAWAPAPGAEVDIGPLLAGFGFDAQGQDLRAAAGAPAPHAAQIHEPPPPRPAPDTPTPRPISGGLSGDGHTFTVGEGEDIYQVARQIMQRLKRRSPTPGEVETAVETLASLNPEVNVHQLAPGTALRVPTPSVGMKLM